MTKKSGEYWEKRIANNTWKVYNSLEEKNRDLLDFYIDASKQIKEELYSIAEKCSKDGVLSLSDMHKQNRLTELNMKYEQIAKDLEEKVKNLAAGNMRDGFQEVYKGTATGMGDNDFSLPNKKLMEKLLDEPWRGDSFSGRIWKNQKKLAAGLNSILLTGLQQGKTVTEMAVHLHNFTGNSFNNCHRIVRTESMHYLNEASLQRYKDSGIAKVRFWAAVDERTCEDCMQYHDKVYPVDKAPVLPVHPNCRCTYLPVIDEEIVEKPAESDIINIGQSIEKEIPKKYVEQFGKKIKKSSEIIQKAWNACADKVKVLSIDYDGISQYDPVLRGIKIDISKIVKDRVADFGRGEEVYKKAYGTLFHEIGHNISSIAAQSRGGEIEEDFADVFKSKKYFVDVDNERGYSLTEMLKQEGNDYIDETWERMKKETVEKGNKQSDIKRQYAFDKIKREIRDFPVVAGGDISDMWEGITKGSVAGYIGHGKSYWDQVSVGTEGFAEMFDATINNMDSLKQIKKFFPKAYEIFEEMLKDIGKGV